MGDPDTSESRSLRDYAAGAHLRSVLSGKHESRMAIGMKQSIVVHYHEISLKKNNRNWFEDRLAVHLESLLGDFRHGTIERIAGRMVISLPDDSPVDEITARMRTVFGVANFAVAWEVPADLDAISTRLLELAQQRRFGSFKVDARRGTKDFPLDSQEINKELGKRIQEGTGAAVRMEDPDLTCFVEIVGRRAFLYFEKVPAGGGLPVGTGGKVVTLLSGGIDSPVAAFRLIRRGCHVIFVHFHSFPHTTPESQEKVRQLVCVLSRYQLESRLYMVPFAEVQREIVAYAPPPLRVILYRRFMLRISEAVALRNKASALVTGDSLGQVASQTLENIRTISSVAHLPVFRPLIGDDKEEIMRVAREIGTYPISIIPDQDCCSLFVPRHPETMSGIDQVENAEKSLDVSRLVESALTGTGVETLMPDFASLSGVRR
jgi:thiamine biosynthesis protein ThiI